MEYKNLVLFGLGVLGILIHNLIKIQQLKKAGDKISLVGYLEKEWASIAISSCIVIAAIILKGEIKQLEYAGNYLGFGFLAIGYMGQSILITAFSKVSKVTGVEENKDN